MRAVIQRVKSAGVVIDGQPVAGISNGLVVLVGFSERDDSETAGYMLDKIINMRIFEDGDGKMNLSVADTGGELLFVPNFTLYGDARKGKRPGYSSGASSHTAGSVFRMFSALAEQLCGSKAKFGIFQADMLVDIQNDGPVTLLLDSDKLF